MPYFDMNNTRAFLLSVVISIIFVACSGTVEAENPSLTAIENTTVLSMGDAGILYDHNVLIEGDRIVSVAPASNADIPAAATRIDGRGKYLMPGLTEMHGHIPPPGHGEQAIKDTLFLYLANGVTTVRGMLGAPGQLDLREAVLSGDILSPTLYLAGPSFNGNSVTSAQDAVQRVKDQAAEGWDLLKIHPGLTAEEYKAMAKQAKAEGIDFAGHVPTDVGLELALSSGQRTIDHIDGYIDYLDAAKTPIGEEALKKAADMTKAANVGIVPTMAVWETLLRAAPYEDRQGFDELRYVGANTLSGWTQFYTGGRSIGFLEGSDAKIRAKNRLRLLKIMADSDVEILFGTDAPQAFSVPGFSIHREIASMREAGMSPEQILNSGTRATGSYFSDKGDRFGLIANGHRADLILLDANPLTDMDNLRNPAGVMVRGTWIPREDIQNQLADIEKRADGTK